MTTGLACALPRAAGRYALRSGELAMARNRPRSRQRVGTEWDGAPRRSAQGGDAPEALARRPGGADAHGRPAGDGLQRDGGAEHGVDPAELPDQRRGDRLRGEQRGDGRQQPVDRDRPGSTPSRWSRPGRPTIPRPPPGSPSGSSTASRPTAARPGRPRASRRASSSTRAVHRVPAARVRVRRPTRASSSTATITSTSSGPSTQVQQRGRHLRLQEFDFSGNQPVASATYANGPTTVYEWTAESARDATRPWRSTTSVPTFSDTDSDGTR